MNRYFSRIREFLNTPLQLKRAIQREELLEDIITTVTDKLDIRDVLSSVESLILNKMKYDVVTICLVNEESNKLEAKLIDGAGVSKEDAKKIREAYKVPLSNSGVGPTVVRDKKAMYIANPKTHPLTNKSHVDIYEKSGIKGGYVMAPMIHQGKVRGTLSVHYKELGKKFKEREIRLIEDVARLSAIAVDNAQTHRKVIDQSITDGLTRVYNHKYFKERLEAEVELARLNKYPLSLVMIDIDNFKIYNDTKGHQAGDEVLKQLAELLKTSFRSMDIVARYGGEEFVAILPKTPTYEDNISNKGAYLAAERTRNIIENHDFIVGGEKTSVKVSIGVATLPEDTSNIDQLIGKADEALYEAKETGRNKVCVYKK